MNKNLKRNCESLNDSDEVIPATQLPFSRIKRYCNDKKSDKEKADCGAMEEIQKNNDMTSIVNTEMEHNIIIAPGGIAEDNYDNLFLDDDDFDIDMDSLQESVDQKYELDLTSWKRCIVKSIQKENRDVVITVEECETKLMAKCRLEAPWNQSKVQEGDTVSLLGEYDSTHKSYVISSSAGMFVVSCDYLVSGTSVVGSLYCARRGVLSDRFKGVDCDNKIMTIGTIVHEVLQMVLKNKLRNIKDVSKIANELIHSRQMLHLLYSSKMSTNEAVKEIETFIPKIANFVKNHIADGVPNLSLSAPKNIQICSIEDIEENIWCPQLGIKGKIDVSVTATNSKGGVELMPLELKTGRASFSSEHTGQLVLYEMMMNLVGHRVNTGLLLYLREEKMRPIESTRHMKRDLIILRNDLAYYLSRGLPNAKSSSFDIQTCIPELPEPINNLNACSKCPYNAICGAFSKKEKLELPASHSMKIISDEVLCYLSNKHIDYFIFWTGLLYLENDETKNSFQLKNIWTHTPEKRYKAGKAVINLVISGNVSDIGDGYIHSFSSSNTTNTILNDTEDLFDITGSHDGDTSNPAFNLIMLGEYLVVSTSKRIAVAAGKVVAVSKHCISMSLERDLSKTHPNESFHLDKYESNSLMMFNLTNLGVLLEDSERSNRLRRMIIDKTQPTFIKNVTAIVARAGEEILRGLNKHQRIAVLMALSTDSYCLFKGLPGTGKTQTVAALIRLLFVMGKSILITSHTHSAVDNVLKKLVKHNLQFIRLGSDARICPSLLKYSETSLTADCETPDQLADVYNKYLIVGVTCLGAAHSLLAKRVFDYCIIDEATQVFQSAVIRPMLSAEKAILIGDPAQLPPVVKSKKAKELGADESLFSRLDTQKASFVLPLQYRMNKCITLLANSLSYKGELQCANDEVAETTLKIPTIGSVLSNRSAEKWLLQVVSTEIDMSVVLVDTLNTFERSLTHGKVSSTSSDTTDSQEAPKSLYSNNCEAALAFYVINALIECQVNGSSIGLIAPFRAQVDTLKYYLENMKKYQNVKKNSQECDFDIEVNTVDQYQGKDKDVIIYSCTKTNNPSSASDNIKASEYEILEDRRRLTVAITRAKHKLIVIGDVQTLKRYTPFSDLFKNISESATIKLNNPSNGFDWQRTFSVLDMFDDCQK